MFFSDNNSNNNKIYSMKKIYKSKYKKVGVPLIYGYVKSNVSSVYPSL